MPADTPRQLLRTLAVIILTGTCALPAVAEELRIDNARVRDLIPGQDKTVGYFEATNPGAAPVIIVGARAEPVRAMEIHTTNRDGDIMRMRRLEEVVVPAGGSVRFQPGGNHLMLFGVRSLDSALTVELLFADGSTQTVSFERIPFGAP